MKPHDGPWPTEPRWNEPATDPALTTIGLPRELAPLATWADSLGLLGPLLLIIDSANVAAFPAQAGTVLGFSRQRVPAELVRSWQLEKPFLPELVQLLEASSVAAAVYRDYPAMPAARPRSQALSGGMLGELPLVALVSCPLPLLSGDTERQFWIEALRTWCFVHWLEAAYRGSGENAYLVTVTNKLRQGMDGDEHWLELFSSLLGPTDSLAAMTRHLSSAAKSALTQPKGSVRRPSHDQLLAHLRNFCEGKAPPDAGDRSHRPGLFQLLAPRLATASAPWPLPAESVPLDSTQTQDAAFPSASILDLPHRESLVVAVDVDDSLTPSQQDVAAKGVLLASIEQYQYLPFSWDHPSPFEREALESWIAAGLDSAQPQLRQLACGAWLAIHTATSLRTLMALGVGEDPDDDWRVGLASGRLHRKPPRRYNGWRARKESLDWIHPLADRIELSLPPAVRQVLEELSRDAHSTSSTVGNLFQSVDLEEHFRREMLHIPDLHRVTSGMLARWQPQALFDATLDPVFSQLVSSHPRSGLPGACAYASYSKSYVTQQLLACVASKVNAHTPDEEPEHNAAGSQLSPIDALLRQAFDDARTAVNELARDPNKWIDHHNALVTYGTLILLTVTAARPVSSPFEDISWVDLEDLSIFVRDKQASAGHTGRLLPLPQQAAEFIQLTLLPHFARLAQLLEPIDPTMAAEVAMLAARQVSSRLPFLFMLSCDPHLAWTEVTETTLRAVGIFRWPLPWNLMRHRATTSLKALGCDHEVVNALMDHGEYGTAAYGPYSPRVWGHDARSAAPKVACLIEQLRLGEIQSPQWNIGKATAVPKPEGGSALSHTDRYGHAARAQARSATKNAAIEQVHREIEAFLAGRKAAAIAGADWDKLLQSMLVQPNGLPHPMGSVRYDELLTWLRQRWNTEDLRLGLKRRYCPALEEPSHFTPSCIGATRLLAQAQDHLRQRLENAAPRTISLRQCLAWFTLSLVIESRIADLRVLKDALGNANVRVVRMQGNLYLEHGPTLDRFPDSPAKRYRLSRHAALLIDRAKSSTRNLHAGKLPVGTNFLGLAAAAGISASAKLTVHALVQQLAAITDQANARELPGVLTGYLNGTVVSAALTHTDWIRCQKGEAAVAPSWTASRKALEDSEDLPAASDESTASHEFVAARPEPATQAAAQRNEDSAPGATRSNAQRAARELFKLARDAINEAHGKPHSPRRDLDRDLKRVLATSNNVSATCRLLVEWVRSLLWHKKKKKGFIELSSVLRYFNSLSVCFQAVGYEHDLRDCDSEEVTLFYQEVMEARLGLKDAEAQEDGDAYRTWRLALQQLRSFHTFVHRTLSVENPDWSEIDGSEDVLSISPGVILESEYQCALNALAPDPNTASRDQLARAFTLLCTYRFGLRGSEATGLLRRDWIETRDGSVVVLVRNNRFRTLKTPSARRQVPLLFELAPAERRIIERLFALWDSISQGDIDAPLLIDPQRPDRLLDERRLRADVSETIKAVTMNPHLSLHHARHTFGNRAGLMLIDGARGVWRHASWTGRTAESEVDTPARCTHVRRLLLGTDAITRRSFWALARLLGHAHPRTTIRSYVHFLPEWLFKCMEPWENFAEGGSDVQLLHVLDLDGLPNAPDYLPIAQSPAIEPATQPLNLAKALRFLRRYQQGAAVAYAAQGAEIELEDADILVRLIQQIDATLERRPHINRSLGGESNLLSHIDAASWEDLQDRFWSRGPEIASGTVSTVRSAQIIREMIGPSRQLLLWKRSHFVRAAQALQEADISPSRLRFVRTSRGHDKQDAWARETGLISEEGWSDGLMQVDAILSGNPPVRIKHRIAVTPKKSEDSWVRSSHVFLLVVSLMLIFQTGR